MGKHDMPIEPYVEGLVTAARKTVKQRKEPTPARFRQGASIRDKTHQCRGVVSISSGDLGGKFEKTTLGQDVEAEPVTFFRDRERVDATNVIRSATRVDDAVLKSISEGVESINGVIEPLTIRDEVTFSSIEGNQICHTIKGDLIEGNKNINGGSDCIEQFITLVNNPEPYADTVASIGTLPLPGERFEETRRAVGFDETTNKGRGIKTSTNMPNDMLTAVRALCPSTEDAVPAGKLSAAAGFIFDSAAQGTDSIAFA